MIQCHDCVHRKVCSKADHPAQLLIDTMKELAEKEMEENKSLYDDWFIFKVECIHYQEDIFKNGGIMRCL